MDIETLQEEKFKWLEKYPSLPPKEEAPPGLEFLSKYPTIRPEPKKPVEEKKPSILQKFRDSPVVQALMRTMGIQKEFQFPAPEKSVMEDRRPYVMTEYMKMGRRPSPYEPMEQIEEIPPVEKKPWKPELDLRGFFDLLSGFYGSAGITSGVLQRYSEMLSAITKLPMGGIFDDLYRAWSEQSARLREKGLPEGVAKEALTGVGGAVWDIPTIIAFGRFGLPIHGAIYGGAEAGVKGAAIGAVRGALIHKSIQGIGMLPSKFRLAGWGGFGATITPGGVEERVAGALTWTALGLAGGSRKVTIEEFLDRYPKVKDRLDEGQARRILKNFARDAKDLEIEEAGGAKAVLDESFRLMRDISERTSKPGGWIRPEEGIRRPPELRPPAERIATEEGVIYPPGTPEAEVLKERYRAAEPKETKINIMPREDGSIDVTMPRPGAEKAEMDKRGMLDSVWAIFEKHPRVLYKDLEKYAKGNEEIATADEMANFFEGRGKEVIGKPEPAVAKKAPTFKEPLYQAVFDNNRVKPNADYTRESLLEIFPRRLIASVKDEKALPMDEMADVLSREFPRIESDTDLYDYANSLMKKPRIEPTERAERERIETEYEEFEEARTERERVAKAKELREGKAKPTVWREDTDMAWYDNMIKNPEYYEKNKGVTWKVAEITPDRYLNLTAKMQGTTVERQIEMADAKLLKEYTKKMKAGEKFPMAVVDYARGEQEGRIRAIAAKQAGIEEMPVLIVNKTKGVEPTIKEKAKEVFEKAAEPTPEQAEGRIRAHMKGKTPEEIAEIRKGLTPKEQKIVDRIQAEKPPAIRFEKAKRESVKDYRLVTVDVDKFDKLWQKDKGYYLKPGESGILGRRKGVEEFIKTGETMEAPIVNMTKEGAISFTDGRHRFVVLRDMGYKTIDVAVPKEQLNLFREKVASAPKPPEIRPEKPVELKRIEPIAERIEAKLREGMTGKELTKEEKAFLKEREMYKKEKRREPAPLPKVEPEEGLQKMNLVKVSVETPTGRIEVLGVIPADRAEALKAHAKSLGIEGKLKVGATYEGKWEQYLPPKEVEKYMKGVIKDVRERPKEDWESWEQVSKNEAEEIKEYYAGVPVPKEYRRGAQKIIDWLMVEPQFKREGAPDTGNAIKRYHSIRETENKRTAQTIKELNKLKYTDAEYQELPFIAARPGKFKPMTEKERARYSPGYRKARDMLDKYEARLKELAIIEEGFPMSAIKRMTDEIVHVKSSLRKAKAPERIKKLNDKLDELQTGIKFLKQARIQYVPIPRTWIEKFFDKDPANAPKILTQFFRQRKTLDIEELAKFLLQKGHIEPKDLDIRNILASYGHRAGHKIAIAEIFKAAEKDGMLREYDEALIKKGWTTLPVRKYPSLRGKVAHPLLSNVLDRYFEKRGWMPPTLSKIFSYSKLMQFWMPWFLPMYDVYQSFWTGALTNWKTPLFLWRGTKSIFTKDKAYWDNSYYGGFSKPFTPDWETYKKQTQSLMQKNTFLRLAKKYVNPYHASWDAAWFGDNWIRMITNHYHLSKGSPPSEAAQLTAKPHGDYAAIAPDARLKLNKIFFTPSFRVAMMSAQSEMVNNLGRLITKGKVGIGEPGTPKYTKAMAKMFAGLVGSLMIQEAVMHKLGYKTDQWGLKYTKEVEDEEGKKRELVVHIAQPGNVWLRYFHRFKRIVEYENPDKYLALLNAAKWDFHPLWQVAQEVLSNKTVSFEPIYSYNDPAWKITRDVLSYVTKRIVRITEVVPGMEKGVGKRWEARKALVKDLGKIGYILNGFSLPYMRNTKEQRLQGQLKQIVSLFKYYAEEKPFKSEEDRIQAIQKLKERIIEIQEELNKLK